MSKDIELKIGSDIDFNLLKSKIASSRLKDDKRIIDIIEALEKGKEIPFKITFKEYSLINQLSKTCMKSKQKDVREYKEKIEESFQETVEDKPKKKKKKKKDNNKEDEFDNINENENLEDIDGLSI